MSSRPERPDYFFRAALWRVGPRSGGIMAQSPRLASLFAFRVPPPDRWSPIAGRPQAKNGAAEAAPPNRFLIADN